MLSIIFLIKRVSDVFILGRFIFSQYLYVGTYRINHVKYGFTVSCCDANLTAATVFLLRLKAKNCAQAITEGRRLIPRYTIQPVVKPV